MGINFLICIPYFVYYNVFFIHWEMIDICRQISEGLF